MDLFVLHGIVEELKKEIIGGFITKIYQMNRTDLLLRLRHPGEEKQILISTHPDFYRLHLTGEKYANPLVPPRFCTYLRKHLTGARIAEVIQDPHERVVRVALHKRMDAGAILHLTLVVELLGRVSNVLLLENGKILDCLHFRREEEGFSRPAAPGLIYQPPAPSGQWLAQELTQEITEQIAAAPPGELWKILVAKIRGISPLVAREIEFISGGSASEVEKNLRFFGELYQRNDFAPRIVALFGEKKFLCPFPLKSLALGAEEVLPTMNRAADLYYFDLVFKRQIIDQKQSLTRRIRQLLSRMQRRRENLAQDRSKFEEDVKLKEAGEILAANYPRLKKGMRQVEALDYREDPPQTVVIDLDEALDPPGNVEKYFKRYKKAKRGLEVTSGRIQEAEEEIAYLESSILQIEQAEDAGELEEIRRELEKERILPLPRKTQEKKEPSLPVRRFRSSEGGEIFCGKHNLGNDYLLRHLAKGNDLWFHAQGFPGSHVVLRVGSKEPKFESVLEAATIAAYFSRGRGSTAVPVDYTAVKNLHHPRGSRPGLVTYSHQRTLSVKPDPARVEKLRIY